MRCTKPSLKTQKDIKRKIAESVIKNLFLQNRTPEAIDVAQKNNIGAKEFVTICESAIK